MKFKILYLLSIPLFATGCCRYYGVGMYQFETYFINETNKDLDFTFDFKSETVLPSQYVSKINDIVSRRKLSPSIFSDSIKIDSISPYRYQFSVPQKSIYLLVDKTGYANGINPNFLSKLNYIIINKDTLSNIELGDYLKTRHKKQLLKKSYYTFSKNY